MNDQLLSLIGQANPWLKQPSLRMVGDDDTPRLQADTLLSPEWDSLWLILIGPRQAGKTTLAKYFAQQFIQQKRFENLLYLNCDLIEIRQWLTDPLFIKEAMEVFRLRRPIILIDEVQRLENPGLLLKACGDFKAYVRQKQIALRTYAPAARATSSIKVLDSVR